MEAQTVTAVASSVAALVLAALRLYEALMHPGAARTDGLGGGRGGDTAAAPPTEGGDVGHKIG